VTGPDPQDPPDLIPPHWTVAGLRLAVRVGLILAIAYGAHLAVEWLMHATERLPSEHQPLARAAAIALACTVYALLIAVPFVPGVEIGVSLLMMRGAEAAPGVYVATLCGLMIAYFAGRHIPLTWLRRLFLDLRLTGACRMIDRLDPLDDRDRLDLLHQRLPERLAGGFLRWRYLWLALLVNLPGSALIGGGGGILMLAGLSRVFAPLPVMLTLLLAVAPVPLLVWLIGPGILS
jgi:hypothetical protein